MDQFYLLKDIGRNQIYTKKYGIITYIQSQYPNVDLVETETEVEQLVLNYIETANPSIDLLISMLEGLDIMSNTLAYINRPLADKLFSFVDLINKEYVEYKMNKDNLCDDFTDLSFGEDIQKEDIFTTIKEDEPTLLDSSGNTEHSSDTVENSLREAVDGSFNSTAFTITRMDYTPPIRQQSIELPYFDLVDDIISEPESQPTNTYGSINSDDSNDTSEPKSTIIPTIAFTNSQDHHTSTYKYGRTTREARTSGSSSARSSSSEDEHKTDGDDEDGWCCCWGALFIQQLWYSVEV